MSVHDEFKAFADEFRNESDRAAVILGAAKLDLLLCQLLQKVLKPSPGRTDELFDGDAPLSTFSSRITLCHRLGLINDEFARALHLVRRIRNSFAHELSGVSLDGGAHRDRIRELVAPYKGHGSFEWILETFFKDDDPRSEFRAAVALMSLRLEGAFESEGSIAIRNGWTMIPPDWDEKFPKKKPANGDVANQSLQASVSSSTPPPAKTRRVPRG